MERKPLMQSRALLLGRPSFQKAELECKEKRWNTTGLSSFSDFRVENAKKGNKIMTNYGLNDAV
jgi:hypothetical protein